MHHNHTIISHKNTFHSPLAYHVNKCPLRHNKHALHSILWSFMIRYPKIQTHSMHQHKFKKKLHYNKFKLFPTSLITKFLESFLWKMMKNNKTFFGQISGLNKKNKILFVIMSFEASYSLAYMKLLKSIFLSISLPP